MSTLSATPSLIVVDASTGATEGSSAIAYQKAGFSEELWERRDAGSWRRINVFSRTGRGDVAEGDGQYSVTLRPGRSYQVGVFFADHGPNTTDPIMQKTLVVFCVWKQPAERRLIIDENRDTGGTWHWHQVHTQLPTTIVEMGVSREPPEFDASGIPHLVKPSGHSTTPHTFTNDHQHEIAPLLPGNRYFFLVVVSDPVGNWDFRIEEIRTKLRKVAVSFTQMTIYNDGDNANSGDGEFWFDIYERSGSPSGRAKTALAVSFHQNEMKIDDWSHVGRPYPLAFGPHVLGPKSVITDEDAILIGSHVVEHDGPFEEDEKGGMILGDGTLSIPFGRQSETVLNQTMFFDCPPRVGSIHYAIKVEFSVAYV